MTQEFLENWNLWDWHGPIFLDGPQGFFTLIAFNQQVSKFVTIVEKCEVLWSSHVKFLFHARPFFRSFQENPQKMKKFERFFFLWSEGFDEFYQHLYLLLVLLLYSVDVDFICQPLAENNKSIRNIKHWNLLCLLFKTAR